MIDGESTAVELFQGVPLTSQSKDSENIASMMPTVVPIKTDGKSRKFGLGALIGISLMRRFKIVQNNNASAAHVGETKKNIELLVETFLITSSSTAETTSASSVAQIVTFKDALLAFCSRF